MLAAERRKYLDNLVPEVARIFRLNQDSRCEEALALVSELQARAKEAHCDSALLWWQRSIAADGLHLWVEAVESISRALRLDPFPAPFLESARIIRERVIDHARSFTIEDRQVGVLCRLLIERLEVLPDVHILYGQHLLALDKLDAATEQASAALRMDPGNIEAWSLRMAIARARGDSEQVERDFEAHLIATGPKAEA